MVMNKKASRWGRKQKENLKIKLMFQTKFNINRMEMNLWLKMDLH